MFANGISWERVAETEQMQFLSSMDFRITAAEWGRRGEQLHPAPGGKVLSNARWQEAGRVGCSLIPSRIFSVCPWVRSCRGMLLLIWHLSFRQGAQPCRQQGDGNWEIETDCLLLDFADDSSEQWTGNLVMDCRFLWWKPAHYGIDVSVVWQRVVKMGRLVSSYFWKLCVYLSVGC